MLFETVMGEWFFSWTYQNFLFQLYKIQHYHIAISKLLFYNKEDTILALEERRKEAVYLYICDSCKSNISYLQIV